MLKISGPCYCCSWMNYDGWMLGWMLTSKICIYMWIFTYNYIQEFHTIFHTYWQLVFHGCLDLFKESRIYLVFIMTIVAELKSSFANVLRLFHWIHTFCLHSLTLMSFRQPKLHCFNFGNHTETIYSQLLL